MLYKMITTIGLVTICHHIKLLQYYWLNNVFYQLVYLNQDSYKIHRWCFIFMCLESLLNGSRSLPPSFSIDIHLFKNHCLLSNRMSHFLCLLPGVTGWHSMACGQTTLTICFCKFYWKTSCLFVCILSAVAVELVVMAEAMSPESLKYLVSGSLQDKCASPC